jgi:hypothetical protein
LVASILVLPDVQQSTIKNKVYFKVNEKLIKQRNKKNKGKDLILKAAKGKLL